MDDIEIGWYEKEHMVRDFIVGGFLLSIFAFYAIAILMGVYQAAAYLFGLIF
jgi:hypothetical protein